MNDAGHEQVSFESEPLILVDENDNEIGFRSKLECHRGHGTLHRAFSIFLFDSSGRVLLQQRSASKPLWPMYWSNSCCSHPRRGETMDGATHRRLVEELGTDADLDYLYKFIYQADFGDVGAEHELCYVYIGRAHGDVTVHPDEIADWKWADPAEVDRMLTQEPERCTPWFKLEWQALTSDWRDRIDTLVEQRRFA